MNRIIYLLLFSLLSGLNNEDSKYYTYGKWALPDELESSYLKDKPKEVRDDYYRDKNDSSLNIDGALNSYEIWKFDDDGNIVFHKLSIDSNSLMIITESSFTNDGLQAIAYTNDSSDIKNNKVKTITKKRGDKFLVADVDSKETQYSIISFSDNGNIKKEEFISDTNNLNDISITRISHYKNGLIQKEELKTKDGNHKVESYFYSKEIFLDSIYIYDNGKLTSKRFFYNNQFGDPIKYFELRPSNDTLTIVSMKYEYDQHNNWIRRVEKTEDKSIDTNFAVIIGSPKLYYYSLSVREIKY